MKVYFMKLLDVGENAVTKLAKGIIFLKPLVLETADIWPFMCYLLYASCIAPLLKCLFKYIFSIVANISVKNQHHHRRLRRFRLIHLEMWAYQSNVCPLLLTDSQLQLV